MRMFLTSNSKQRPNNGLAGIPMHECFEPPPPPSLAPQVEYGVRHLMREHEGCREMIKCVVDSTGIPIGGALKLRGVFSRVAHVLDRQYPWCVFVVGVVGADWISAGYGLPVGSSWCAA